METNRAVGCRRPRIAEVAPTPQPTYPGPVNPEAYIAVLRGYYFNLVIHFTLVPRRAMLGPPRAEAEAGVGKLSKEFGGVHRTVCHRASLS